MDSLPFRLLRAVHYPLRYQRRHNCYCLQPNWRQHDVDDRPLQFKSVTYQIRQAHSEVTRRSGHVPRASSSSKKPMVGNCFSRQQPQQATPSAQSAKPQLAGFLQLRFNFTHQFDELTFSRATRCDLHMSPSLRCCAVKSGELTGPCNSHCVMDFRSAERSRFRNGRSLSIKPISAAATPYSDWQA